MGIILHLHEFSLLWHSAKREDLLLLLRLVRDILLVHVDALVDFELLQQALVLFLGLRLSNVILISECYRRGRALGTRGSTGGSRPARRLRCRGTAQAR
jgi:hypothetical protein